MKYKAQRNMVASSVLPRIAKVVIPETLNSNLLTRTLYKKQLPGKREILRGAKKLAVDFVRNPIKITREGLERDRIANRIANLHGYSRWGLVGKGVHTARKPIKELAINTGGLIGSHMGAAGGIAGELAGDWMGSYLTRRSIDDAASLTSAIKESVNSPAWRQKGVVGKFQDIHNKTTNDILEKAAKDSSMFDDTVGWGVGNTVAAVPVPIPLKGAAAAMTYGEDVGQGIKKAMSGIPVKQAARETWDSMKSKLPKAWEAESQFYNEVNSKLQTINYDDKALKLLNDYLMGLDIPNTIPITAPSIKNVARYGM